MKNFFNFVMTKFSGILIVVFITLICYSFNVSKRLHEAKQKSKALETTITDMHQKMQSLEIRMNDSTKLHAAIVMNLRMTSENVQAKYDELLAASKIKPKDVNSVATVATEIRDTVYVPVKVDSFGGMQTGYRDNFIDISVDISPDRLATIGYASRDSLSLIVTQKKHSILFGLIKWKSLEKTMVVNHNPKATITSVETINVIE